MTDHVRKQMRTRVTGTSLLGLTSVQAGNIHDSLVYPLQPGGLPAIRIGLENEDINIGEQRAGQAGFSTLLRTVELVLELCAKEVATYEDTLDAIQLEVEQAMSADATLGGLCKHLVPSRVETERDDAADKPVATRRLIFAVFYVTAQNAPQTPL